MRTNSKLRRSILSGVVAVAMVGSLSFAPALASAQESQQLATGAVSEVPEWAIDDGENAESAVSTQAVLPDKYDLRDEGLVTPVKFQNPWGSCWAFGGTAAAEISIISAYGSTYEDSGLDLSERHLTYFALQPVSEAVNSDQVGEGLHTLKPGVNAAFDAGGQNVYITTLFSQGIGPMLEELYPYRGNDAIRTLDVFDQDPEKETRKLLEKELGGEAAANAYIAKLAQNSGKSEEEAFAELVVDIRGKLEASPTYSDTDDWTIPETNADGTPNRLVSNGMVLTNGNVLPEYWTGGETPNEAGMNAIKQEILNGRGVSIAFYCEQGTTYANKPGDSNKDQAQYVFDNLGLDHGVCIVGWDDSYAKENFSHELKVAQPDGTEVDRTAETTPPGDGAWIVKNSYGSETDYSTDDLGNTVNKSKWGTLNDEGLSTGYFYLSYYDKTIQQVESMEFAADLGADGVFTVLQHDYMPANGGFYTTSPTTGANVTSSANIFEAGDEPIVVKSVSTRTSETNARVTFAIYELNDGATDPTDGEMLYRTSKNFEYGGFHRLNLDQPITIEAGKKFSVVSTMSTVDSTGKRCYNASANQGFSKKYIEETTGGKAKIYSTAVINEGESFLYKDGSWQDWKDYTNALLPIEEMIKRMPSAEKYVDVAPIDNFSIKVYAEPKGADTYEANPMTVKANQVTAKAKKKTTIAASKAFDVKDAKGAVSFYKASGNAKITVGAAGKVTVKKGLKKGKTYKAKVLVTAAGDERYAPSTKTVTLKVKVK